MTPENPQNPGQAKTLRLALVGCGAISKMHRMGIQQGAPRIEITAVVDVNRANAENVAGETGADEELRQSLTQLAGVESPAAVPVAAGQEVTHG